MASIVSRRHGFWTRNQSYFVLRVICQFAAATYGGDVWENQLFEVNESTTRMTTTSVLTLEEAAEKKKDFTVSWEDGVKLNHRNIGLRAE